MTANSPFHTFCVRPVVTVYSAARTLVILLVVLFSLAANFIAFSSSGLALALASAIEPVTGDIKGNLTLKKENERLRTVIQSQNLQLRRAAASLSRASSDIRYRDGQLVGKSLALEKATGSLRLHQSKIVRLNDALPRMRSTIVRTASANAASVVAESIPFWGSVAVLVATSLELRELCTVMTEINTLEVGLGVALVADDDAKKVCGLMLPSWTDVQNEILSSPQAAWDLAKGHLTNLPAWSGQGDP